MKFDFDSIRGRLINNLRKRVSWARILPNSVNMRLIETVAEEETELVRYDEYLLRESKWNLARNVSSLFLQSSMIGYRPHRRIGAIGTVEVSSSDLAFSSTWNSYTSYDTGEYVRYGDIIYSSSIDSNLNSEPTLINTNWVRVRTNHTRNIGIPKYTEFQGENGLTYSSIASETLLANQDFVRISVVQGIKNEYSSLARGITFEEVYIDNSNIENNYYEVFVNGTLWHEVDNLKGADPNQLAYQTFDSPDFSRVYFRFGDDITGKRLISGDQITIYWLETRGVDGNISTEGKITSILSSILDIDNTPINASCYNYNAIAGGKDTEDLESIRRNGTLSFQAGDRLVSAPDYTTYLETNFSFIGKAVVWGAYEQNLDNGSDPWDWITPTENLIYLAGITPGSDPLDILKNADGSDNDTYKIEIMRGIREIKSPTDVVSFQNVEFIYMTVTAELSVENENYLLPEVIDNVKTALISEYGIEIMTFRKEIYESNYQYLIDSIEGVHHHTSEFSFYKKTEFNSGFGFNIVLPLFAIEASSITIIAEHSGGSSYTLATDDGSGNFTAPGGVDWTISVGSSVSYALGSVNFDLDTTGTIGGNPYQEYVIKVYYDSVEKDILPKERYQIVFLDEDELDISASYYSGI